MPIRIFTIGFTKSTAENFFTRLRRASVRRVVDVRLNNVSQLAGFAKRDDLAYFLGELCSAEYSHEPLLAPTQPLLDTYKKKAGSWSDYERDFLGLMEDRRIESQISPELLDGACLLCSEHTPHQCHRRLVAEYLTRKWGGIEVLHL